MNKILELLIIVTLAVSLTGCSSKILSKSLNETEKFSTTDRAIQISSVSDEDVNMELLKFSLRFIFYNLSSKTLKL